MKKLVSSSEAAQLLGLSLQGIHYRIKKGQLESIKKDGKIFVYVDDTRITTIKNTKTQPAQEINSLALRSKDEQILLLKKTLKYIKKQHDKELKRLDNSQNKILDVFQSEVDLLKSAFSEMKNIYKVEQKDKQETNDKNHEDKKTAKLTALDLSNFKSKKQKENIKEYITLKEFFQLLKNSHKNELEIKQIILDKMKIGDKRFIYDQLSGELKIIKSDFLDII